MAKMKFPNPKFFRAKDNVDWKAQGRNLQEVGGIIWDMLKETDWKAFAAKQKANVQDNVRRVVREARTIAAMASEILIGKTILEALNTDLVCDAINTAMRELFLQIVYGRSQSAFSEGGLSVGASLEDLGKGLRSQVGTMFATKAKGPRYLEMAEGYVTRVALNKEDEIVGYEFISLGKMMDFIKKGDDAATALEKAKGHYGQFDNAAKYIDPRQE